MTVRSDLEELLQLELNPGEAPAAYAKRLAIAANNLSDDDWQSLGDGSATQIWVNDALEAVEKKKAIPLPEGLAEAKEASAEVEVKQEESALKTNGVASGKSSTKKAAAKAPAKAKKAASAKKASTKGARPGPKGLFGMDSKIKIVAKENPFREGSKGFSWFKKYQNGMTVSAAVAAGVPRAQVRWDLKHGSIKVG